MSKADWIFYTSDATFEADVLAKSRQTLVVLDFWAEWCGPCRALAPILEKLAADYAGRFLLVKANTDETPEAATRYGISGIPALLAFFDGEVVDALEGALPERTIKSWIDNLLATASLRAAERLSSDDPQAAEQALRAILQSAPSNREASVALAQHLLQHEQIEESQQIIQNLEAQAPLEPAAEKIKATLELRVKGGLDVESARAAATAAPNDFGLQLALAEALVGKQAYTDAFEICLDLVARDRKRTGEQARALMVQVFRALPDDSPLTSEYRRKLSLALY